MTPTPTEEDLRLARAALEAIAPSCLASLKQRWVNEHAPGCSAFRAEARREVEGAMRADDKRLEDAAVRVWGEHRWGCDTPDQMADAIIDLRAQVQSEREACERIVNAVIDDLVLACITDDERGVALTARNQILTRLRERAK